MAAQVCLNSVAARVHVDALAQQAGIGFSPMPGDVLIRFGGER